MTRRKKYPANQMRDTISVRYIIGRETWLHNFGGFANSSLSDINFGQLSYGDTTEFRLGVIFGN